MHKRTTSILLFTLFLTGNLSAQQAANPSNTPQETPANSLNAGSIASQFDYINQNSNNYQDYKVVRKTYLEKIKNNITDSLNIMRTQLATANNAMQDHNGELKNLRDTLAHAQTELERIQEEKESFTFLGILMPKTAYNTMVWSIIAAMVIMLVIFIYRHKQSNATTVTAQKNLNELKDDFDKHRKRAMEREQRLNRQLQDELNKRL